MQEVGQGSGEAELVGLLTQVLFLLQASFTGRSSLDEPYYRGRLASELRSVLRSVRDSIVEEDLRG